MNLLTWVDHVECC